MKTRNALLFILTLSIAAISSVELMATRKPKEEVYIPAIIKIQERYNELKEKKDRGEAFTKEENKEYQNLRKIIKPVPEIKEEEKEEEMDEYEFYENDDEEETPEEIKQKKKEIKEQEDWRQFLIKINNKSRKERRDFLENYGKM